MECRSCLFQMLATTTTYLTLQAIVIVQAVIHHRAGHIMLPQLLLSFVCINGMSLRETFGDLTALWQYHSVHHNRFDCLCAKYRSSGISQTREKLISQKPEKTKDKIVGTGCIDLNFGGIQPCLLFKKAFQHKDRVPQRPRYNNFMKTGILIKHKIVSGAPPVMAKVFAVRSGIDCSDRSNKAHFVSRGISPPPQTCASGSAA